MPSAQSELPRDRGEDRSLNSLSLGIRDLLGSYRSGHVSPPALIERLYERIAAHADRGIWITLLPREQALAQATALLAADPASLPLYGVPFAIKDNLDLAGTPTTAACPDFAYVPGASAHPVQRLMQAGAIPIGKTNMDQFATGLVGTRSPYGVCRNSFDRELIAGGSSSGSAVAVACGLVSFALGSDTAGSGRIPAAFNNIVGLKPTRGRLSPRGMVPICRSLDAVSIFALDAEDAATVCRAAEGFDPQEPYSRRLGAPSRLFAAPGLRFGVPRADELEFFGNREYHRLFQQSVAALEALGGCPVELAFAPLREVADLLYGGPWLAERHLVIESLLARKPSALHPVTREVIERGACYSAADAFRAQYRLEGLRRRCESIWEQVDVLVTPTAGTIYGIDEVESDPIRLNNSLGFYTNFVNLLDWSAVATPAGFTASGVPFGVTLQAPAWSDYPLLALAAKLQRRLTGYAGANALELADPGPFDWSEGHGTLQIAVCGAHLSGQPLNHQLRDRGAVQVASTVTAPVYRLYALAGGPPARPGLVRVERGGVPIEVEVWSLPQAALGGFAANIPSPLALGKVLLANGLEVCGFVCEGHAAATAEDISSFGGWRRYIASRR
jgi:allophanate hydrolase